MQPSATVSVYRATINRAAVNRENAQHSTGPRSEAGKQRSSLNALTHGLTARTAVLPSEDLAAYEQHCRQFRDEYKPKTPTETQLVKELADTAWRLNRVPLLEADVLARAQNGSPARQQGDTPAPSPEPPSFDIVDAHRLLTSLGLHGHRLSRQFQKTLIQLREIQSDRYERERRDLRDAAAIVKYHEYKGIPYDPAQDGFVFSKDQIEAFAQRMMRLNQGWRAEPFLLHGTKIPRIDAEHSRHAAAERP